MPFAWSAGANITGDDQKEFTFDTPEMQEGLKYYQSFFTDKLAGTDLPPNQTEAQFVSGAGADVHLRAVDGRVGGEGRR